MYAFKTCIKADISVCAFVKHSGMSNEVNSDDKPRLFYDNYCLYSNQNLNLSVFHRTDVKVQY